VFEVFIYSRNVYVVNNVDKPKTTCMISKRMKLYHDTHFLREYRSVRQRPSAFATAYQYVSTKFVAPQRILVRPYHTQSNIHYFIFTSSSVIKKISQIQSHKHHFLQVHLQRVTKGSTFARPHKAETAALLIPTDFPKQRFSTASSVPLKGTPNIFWLFSLVLPQIRIVPHMQDNEEKIQVIDSPHALEHYKWKQFNSELKLAQELKDSRPLAILSPQPFKDKIPDGCVAVCGQDFFTLLPHLPQSTDSLWQRFHKK
jgi:hypothetical protein